MYVVEDETTTEQVMELAASRVGKDPMSRQILQLTEYLTTTHWFANAGDLRTAMASHTHWNALDVPTRLKLELCAILNEEEATTTSSVVQATAAPPPAYDAIWEEEGQPEPETLFPPTIEPTKKGEATEWTCSVCTLLNPLNAAQCQACASAGPAPLLRQATQVLVEEEEEEEEENLLLPTASIVQAVDNVDVAQVAPEYQYSSMAWSLNDPSGGPVWDCKLCGYAQNRMIEAFCERCCEHVSQSHSDEYNETPMPPQVERTPSAPEMETVRPTERTEDDPYSWLDTEDMEDKPIKYPSLRDEMFHHNEVTMMARTVPPPPPEPCNQPEMVLHKRKLRLPWQSKYKLKKKGEKSKTSKALEKLAFSLRREDASSSESSSSSDEESSDEDDDDDDDDEEEEEQETTS